VHLRGQPLQLTNDTSRKTPDKKKQTIRDHHVWYPIGGARKKARPAREHPGEKTSSSLQYKPSSVDSKSKRSPSDYGSISGDEIGADYLEGRRTNEEGITSKNWERLRIHMQKKREQPNAEKKKVAQENKNCPRWQTQPKKKRARRCVDRKRGEDQRGSPHMRGKPAPKPVGNKAPGTFHDGHDIRRKEGEDWLADESPRGTLGDKSVAVQNTTKKKKEASTARTAQNYDIWGGRLVLRETLGMSRI